MATNEFRKRVRKRRVSLLHIRAYGYEGDDRRRKLSGVWMCDGRRTAVVSGGQQPFKLRPGSMSDYSRDAR